MDNGNMKYIISENKINKIVSSWMNQNFSEDQLKLATYRQNPNIVLFKKNGKVVMEMDMEDKHFGFDYDEIWSFFESVFGMEYEQIQEVLSQWLADDFKVDGYTPHWRGLPD